VENSDVEDCLDEARRLFEGRPTGVETGLDVDGAELVQLRKACRLIDAARRLRAANGHYTVVVETSFGAIERTIQYYLLNDGLLGPDEYVDHQTVYDRGYEAGLYDDEFREKLRDLWRNNRSRSYYREGVATEARAAAMLELAAAIHRHVLHLGGHAHECICDAVGE